MQITIGTFNLNNLFSRFNFSAAVTPGGAAMIESTSRLDLTGANEFRFREFAGRLVTGKNPVDRQRITERIRRIDLDVLAVQEVEDIDTLKRFNQKDLGRRYPHIVLVEGNDLRLIDVGLLSKFPIGGVTLFELFDQIWLSPSLARRQTSAHIDRRVRAGGDGSDHDPAWVVLDL